MSDGRSSLTEDHAKRLRQKVYRRIREDKLFDQAERLMKSGAEGYPDEPDFKYFAAVAGFSFSIVQAPIHEPLVYGSGPVCLKLRRHEVADGAGHLSPHFDIISYEAPAILEYESLGVAKLDAYRDFLSATISADATIGLSLIHI